MAYLEIDRLKVPELGNGEGGAIDLQLGKGSAGCLFSRDPAELRAIADAVCGFSPGYEGRIFLAGTVTEGRQPGSPRISVCGFNVGLYNHLNVTDNLALPLKASGISDFETVARIDAALEDFNLHNIAGEYPEDLDQGEKLKLSFAKATITSPELIVCYLVGARYLGFEIFPLLSFIKQYVNTQKLTLLAVTDDGFSALTLADHIAYVHSGATVQQGSPRDLINSPEQIVVAEDFAFPQLNRFEGIVTEESPFLFVESADQFFNLPDRLRDYFRARIGTRQQMAVRPERVHLIHPDDVQRRGRNIVTLSRVDYLGFGNFVYFDFGTIEWCAFIPSTKVAYTGMQLGVFVPEEEWFFVDDTGKILLDL